MQGQYKKKHTHNRISAYKETNQTFLKDTIYYSTKKRQRSTSNLMKNMKDLYTENYKTSGEK